MTEQRLEHTRKDSKQTNLDINDFESVKNTIESLRPIDEEPFNEPKYISRRNALYQSMLKGVKTSSNTSRTKNETWLSTLTLLRELILYYPTFLYFYIKDEKKQLPDAYKHDHLHHDLVPLTISTSPKFNPIDALWKTIFLQHLHTMVENPETLEKLCFLTTTLYGLGWGRDITINDETGSSEKYFRDLSPEISTSIDEMVQEKQQTGLDRILSTLVTALSAGKTNDETYLKGGKALNLALEKQTTLAQELFPIVFEYAGFFHHRIKKDPQHETAATDASPLQIGAPK